MLCERESLLLVVDSEVLSGTMHLSGGHDFHGLIFEGALTKTVQNRIQKDFSSTGGITPPKHTLT